MFTAKVYKIMVGSLSGAMEEVYIAKERIRKWNQQNAESTGKVFMPIEWSTAPEVFQNVDVVVGVIDNWIDNSSFIENCLKIGKHVMLFFNTLQDPINTIHGEIENVQMFLNRVQSRCYCANYKGRKEFEDLLNNQFEVF